MTQQSPAEPPSPDADEPSSRNATGIVTVRDVAASAKVSLSTVSNVLNRPHRVAPETLARVQSAINDLGYIRNDAARALRLGESRAIGFVVTDVTSPFYSDVMQSASQVLASQDYTVLVGSAFHQEETVASLVELFEAQRVRGLLINPIRYPTDVLNGIERRGVPMVYVDMTSPAPGSCSVSVDHEAGGRLAIHHLHSLGRTSVALVRGPAELQQISARLRGARAACEELGLRCEEITTSTYFVRGGIQAGSVIASRSKATRPDAVFAANDVLAMGVLAALTDRRIDVPNEIAVVGYDDTEMSVAGRIPLTTIRQPADDIGTRAATLLIQEIEHRHRHEHEHTSFSPELVVRASTLQPNSGG